MDISVRFRAALLVILWGWLAAPSLAHPAPFSYLDLRLNQGQWEGKLVAHVIDLAHELGLEQGEALLDPATAETKREALLGLLRARLSVAADGRALAPELLRLEPLPDQQAIAMHLRFSDGVSFGVLSVQCALFPYDPEHQTFLNIYEGDALAHQEILTRDRTGFDYYSGTRQGAIAVVRKFVPGGIHHIFTGPDHILFILGLLLLGGTLARLLMIVTAFTVAHSITLSLAALGVFDIPAGIVEPAIALSIVYVGIDNLMVGRNGRDVRALIAFFFGLIHGFGFAGVLREFGLPRQALGWSLFSFNFGVEIGQIVIVVIVAGLLAALRRRSPALSGRIVTLGSIVVILAGSWWFVQRVFF
ncbi:MAG: HupE/UreJ family protein [Blastocatellia bacterium]